MLLHPLCKETLLLVWWCGNGASPSLVERARSDRIHAGSSQDQLFAKICSGLEEVLGGGVLETV